MNIDYLCRKSLITDNFLEKLSQNIVEVRGDTELLFAEHVDIVQVLLKLYQLSLFWLFAVIISACYC